MTQEQKTAFLRELQKLHHRKELFQTVGADYFEPGMMEYLDQAEGQYDPDTGNFLLRFDSRGTRYDGRTELIERVREKDPVYIERDSENPFNHNNFRLLTRGKKDIGNMPAELCNVIAPLYDVGNLEISKAFVSYVEPISRRNRHARQAILFVQMQGRLNEK